MILDGRHIKKIILDELRESVSLLVNKPKLVVIQVGNEDASNVYIEQKIKMCEYVGYKYEHIKLDNNVSTDMILDVIKKLNNDDSVNGIMVQLPLPKQINTDKVVNEISYLKDVDGLTDINNGMLFHGKKALYSCTSDGIMELLDRYNISISGKNVVVVGRSNLVGKPIAMMMLDRDASVTVCHSKTKDLSEYTKMADILIVAVGKANFITSDMVSDGVIIIDVGINRLGEKIYGDVDYESVSNKCSYITPVPGGVGQMTVAMLAKNILKALEMQKRN